MSRWTDFLDKGLSHKDVLALQQWLRQLLAPGPAPDRLLVLDGAEDTATAILDVMSHLVTLEQPPFRAGLRPGLLVWGTVRVAAWRGNQ